MVSVDSVLFKVVVVYEIEFFGVVVVVVWGEGDVGECDVFVIGEYEYDFVGEYVCEVLGEVVCVVVVFVEDECFVG